MHFKLYLFVCVVISHQNPLKVERVNFDMKYNKKYFNITMDGIEKNEKIGLVTVAILENLGTCFVSSRMIQAPGWHRYS
jgi:hypothetical protein